MGVMTTDAAALKRAATKYRKAVERAEEIQRQASAELAEAVRDAYAGGLKKSEILRATDYVWSRTWLDNAIRQDPAPETLDRSADREPLDK